MNKTDSIYVAGHLGMVGSAIHRLLKQRGYTNVITASKQEMDLRDHSKVRDFFKNNQPKFVFLSAAKVGGIQSNIDSPAQFLYDNLAIQNHIIHESYLSGVKKILFLASSCIYPRECPQPMPENHILTGALEPTNEGYALAKIAGLKLIKYYQQQYGFSGVSLCPSNVYGPNDSFNLEKSHVLSALVRRFVDATDSGLNEITLWGTGSAKREFLHVDDLAKACLFFMHNSEKPDPINIGWGKDISIKQLASIIAEGAGFRGKINWDSSKPDGMPRKCLDTTKMEKLGFRPKISLREGITYMIGYYRQIKNTSKSL